MNGGIKMKEMFKMMLKVIRHAQGDTDEWIEIKEKFKLMLKKIEGKEIILFGSVISLLWVLLCISSG